ncbi:MAG: acyltransferase family protein [Deltaproteobacteria bacterium]|nr:acyltransferase family protein [Deltaproteobacteria bacterium]
MNLSSPPLPDQVQRALGALRLFREFADPLFLGAENIPAHRPLVFVGNHTTYGLFDTMFLFEWLYHAHGIFLRSMGDHVHFKVPLWRDVLSGFGVVEGDRETASTLLSTRESILVFPGGAREVARRKNEKYPVIWKDRTGFARLAIRHGCDIIPFAAIGIDDAWDVVYDAEDAFHSRLGPVLKVLGVRPEATMPVVKGLGGTPLPRPERVYFRILPPVSTRAVQGRQDDDAVVMEVRERARTAVQRGITELLRFRELDPDRNVFLHAGRRVVEKLLEPAARARTKPGP